MEFDELMTVFHAAVSAVHDGKIAEADITCEREVGGLEENITISVRSEVSANPYHTTYVQHKTED